MPLQQQKYNDWIRDAEKEDTATLCADPLYLIPSNPCNATLKYSFIGTRILISLTWRTRCIRNAPCRCIAYAVSSFSADTSSQYTFSTAAPFFNMYSYKSEAAGTFVKKILDKVKTCDAALIREMKLSEWNEFFIFLIAFSCITGLLLCLMFCNRSRKHPLPVCPEYVSQSTVSK